MSNLVTFPNNILHESHLINYNGETRKCLKSESCWDTDLTIIFLIGEEYNALLVNKRLEKAIILVNSYIISVCSKQAVLFLP